ELYSRGKALNPKRIRRAGDIVARYLGAAATASTASAGAAAVSSGSEDLSRGKSIPTSVPV
ncbi:unnamed protein product, partial [Amoebophrya sp. A25]